MTKIVWELQSSSDWNCDKEIEIVLNYTFVYVNM